MPLTQLADLQLRTGPALLLGVLLVASAAALRAVLDPWFGGQAPFIAFTLPIVGIAVLGGWWPGFATTVLAALVANVLFVEPRGSLTVGVPAAWFSMTTLVVLGLLSSALGEWLRRAALADANRQRAALGRERALLDLAPQIVWEADADGAITHCNAGWHAYSGLTDGESRGDGWAAAIDPSQRDAVLAAWKAAATREDTYELEIPFRRAADGAVRWHLARGRVLRTPDGRREGWIGVAIDIDERRSAEARAREAAEPRTLSEARLRALTDTLPQLVWSTRADGYADYFNERWYAYTGMERPRAGDTDHGWRWTDYLHPDDAEATREAWGRALATGVPYAVEYRLRGSDGTYRWFMARGEPVRDSRGSITRWYGSCTDIEAQRQGVAERDRLLAAERAARSELERTARVKDEFVATLSHELRTPLNAILGWTKIARDRPSDRDLVVRSLDVIDRNSRAQLLMVEDLLDVNRILTGKLKLEPEPIELDGIVDAALAAVQAAADAKQIALVRRDGPPVALVADPTRLQQVLWNLLSNAVKFTPAAGRVEIGWSRSDTGVEITVQDDGMGIAPDLLPYVFDRFRQGDASLTRRHGGLGIGLSIVKHVVEMHGGRVGAESAGAGQGATFTVWLPVATAYLPRSLPRVEAADAGAREAVPSLAGLRVLVLDDEPDARALVQQVLSDAGAEVVTVESARAALDVLKKGPRPDVVVSDIGMPEQDGYDFIRHVRRFDADLPAAALTALARMEDRKRALLAGFQTHVAKPVDPTELVAVVASLSRRTG